MKEGYIKQKDRKNILLLTDDIRVHSGVAQIGREIVMNTAHRYNWVQLAGSIKHPDKGKIQDLSADTNKHMGITDSKVLLYPCDGYGDAKLVHHVIKEQKIDALFLITDPRYFEWLFRIENEIRDRIPIAYLNIWDDLPAPMYNKEFYNSCDALFGISKQTKNINEMVLGEDGKSKIIRYIPHGLNDKIFKPLPKDDKNVKEILQHLTGNDNSRNIRRKSIPDTILAWKYFLDGLSKEKRSKCRFILHTQAIDDNGTDLPAVIRFLFPNKDHNIIISDNRLSTAQMSLLYNVADATILLSSAEGWGLSLTESLLTGTPIIANVTGGMQDQMRFEDENGDWYTPNPDVPSNHKRTYTKCGEWALPVFPNNLSLVGSPRTPYIYDDRCSAEDAALQIKAMYDMGKEERQKIGESGRKWVLSKEAVFTSERQAERVIEGLDELFSTWTPRPKFTFCSDKDYNKRVLNHKLVY